MATTQWSFRAIASAIICTTLSIVALYLRKHDLFTNPQFYAEDGTIIFSHAYQKGCQAIFDPYPSYYIVYQRLVGCAGTLVPLEHIPLFYFLGLLLTILIVNVYIFSSRVTIPYQVIAALVLTLSPVGNEVFFGVTNSQWILALILVLIAVSKEPRSRSQVIIDISLLGCVGLTGPYCIVFAPIFVIRLLWYRDKWSFVLVSLIGLLCVWQLLAIDNVARVPGAGGTLYDFARVISVYFSSLFIGPNAYTKPYFPEMEWFFTSLAFGIYANSAVFSLRKKDFTLLACTLSGTLILLSTLYVFRLAPLALIGTATRYWYIPTIAFSWMLLCLSKYRPKTSFFLALIMVVNVICNFSHYQGPYFKDHNWKKWSSCLETKSQVCIIPHPPGIWQTMICKTQSACDKLLNQK